jgi:hypothetical protein
MEKIHMSETVTNQDVAGVQYSRNSNRSIGAEQSSRLINDVIVLSLGIKKNLPPDRKPFPPMGLI